MHAIVLADGDAPTRAGLDASWRGWNDGVALVVAADGGARLAASLGLALTAWVGDGDSLGSAGVAELERLGIPVTRAREDKDESDAELAVLEAIRLGATSVTVLGGLGGRFDHTLANVGLLAHRALDGIAVQLLDDQTRVRLASGADTPVSMRLPGRVGDIVSLIPFGGDAASVTTDGLEYPLRDEPLAVGPARGLSNVRLVPDASVTVRKGRLLVIERPATLGG